MIEVGEYVRFKNGIIEKVNEDEADRLNMFSKNVGVHSNNILDIIKLGDYVNGYPVIAITYRKKSFVTVESDYDCDIHIRDIKTIVTQEQMRKIEYRVGDKR